MAIQEFNHLVQETFTQWREEDITRLGAALAYFAAFSLLPMLLLATTIAGAVFGQAAIENQIVQRINEVIGHEAAQAIRGTVQHVMSNGNSSSITTIISLLAL